MPHDRMLATRGGHTWIHKYIFPGGQIPSLQAITDTLREHTSLRVTADLPMGPHYARTLAEWRGQFLAAADGSRRSGSARPSSACGTSTSPTPRPASGPGTSTCTSSSWSAGGDRGTARPPGAADRPGIPSGDDRGLVPAADSA